MILPLEQQVTSPMLSADLEELGARQEGRYEWRKYSLRNNAVLLDRPSEGTELATLSGKIEWTFSAYTVSELGALIPRKVNIPQKTEMGRWWRMSVLNIHRTEDALAWVVAYIQPNSRQIFKEFTDKNLAEAMGDMVAWLLENELIAKNI